MSNRQGSSVYRYYGNANTLFSNDNCFIAQDAYAGVYVTLKTELRLVILNVWKIILRERVIFGIIM